MSASPITFLVPGQAGASRGSSSPAASGALPGRVKAQAIVGALRAGAAPVRLEAVPGEDVVVLHLAGGPALVLHPETARELMLGQSTAERGGGASGDVAVPVQLRWQGLEQAAPSRRRGFLGDVLLQAVEVITGLSQDAAADLAASAVVARVDGQVRAGVYALEATALRPLKQHGSVLSSVPASGEPILVWLHGTFVDTASTFGKLWDQHPAQVQALFRHYGGRVYALDHPTLGASPITNALTLAQALPKGARLHLATHSRGGLVAEVLARVCGRAGVLDADDLAPFAGPAQAAQRRDLLALAELVKARGLRVERVVRVACPARGTLLASRRLDAYLSVLRWSLQLAGVPVAPELLAFLSEVARRRGDPQKLPGLAAMLPDSPLVHWLNGGEPVAGELRVIAGDLEGDSLGSWVKTLLADAFYWTDNDIVVQTRSMYGGTPRARGGAQYLLDQGGRVTHFNYFANERTVQALVNGLTQDRPADFRTIGPLSWAGEDASGVRALRGTGRAPAAGRPAVILLPGILGSHLKVGDRRVWIGPRLVGGLKQLAWRAGADDAVSPDGPIGMFYDRLAEFLDASHEVIPFAFDWRRPIEQEAARLADTIDRELALREAAGLPVRLLAHSMGGLVARTVQLVRPETWQRLMARSGARLLMLGTPNAGSWSPMQTLSGDDGFGNLLASIGGLFDDEQARQLMAGMPGFLQLQAGLPDDDARLAREQTWRELAERDLEQVRAANWWHRNWLAPDDPSQLAPYVWGVPPQAVLDQALALRRRLDEQRERDLPAFADRLLLVVGRARFTPDGWRWGDAGLEYLDAVDGGDGRVPLASALLPGVRAWTLDAEHGDLPCTEAAFAAYAELLERGDTARLPRLTLPGTPPAHVPNRPARGGASAARPPESMGKLLAGSTADEAAGPEAVDDGRQALVVGLYNGDLSFLPLPLMLGHYRSAVLTGTERAVDRMLGGAMSTSLAAGLYPDLPGHQQIFSNGRRDPQNPWREPTPAAAIVVGLGDEGRLKTAELIHAARQGALAWAQRLVDGTGGAGAPIELAATLFGSGSVGTTPGQVAAAIVQGVREANDALQVAGWPRIRRLRLVELYHDRAAEAWRSLRVIATAQPGLLKLEPTIERGTGALQRPLDSAYRGIGYDLISAHASDADEGVIAFRLDTRRARSEVRVVSTQARLVRNLVRRADGDPLSQADLGQTLFQLLVPPEVEPFLAGNDPVQLELDDRTAAIPWELLDTPARERAGGDPRPWSVRTRLLRRLATVNFRAQVRDAGAEAHALVVGEPMLGDARYLALPGAYAEAQSVGLRLKSALGEPAVELLLQADAIRILNTLFARPWRIVHIAGHGEPGAEGGVVMSDGTFLGPREIAQMRTVPEMVFVNCCHLAARDPEQVLAAPGTQDRAQFAAGVAQSLIEIGVRCVVAAGWAVGDAAAVLFADTLYRELLAGQRFIDAVGAAREAAWSEVPDDNTWAAYQCYGDPDWVLRPGVGGAPAVRDGPAQRYALVASPEILGMALQELAVRAGAGGAHRASIQEDLRHLESRFGPAWRGQGAVAEAFARAWQATGDAERALGWYWQAVRCNDGGASLHAQEQLLNLRVRQAWAHAQSTRTADRARAVQEIREAIAELDLMAQRHPTRERLNLLGSAWKRLAMLESADDIRRGGPRQQALSQARACYERAESDALEHAADERFYPAMNRIAIAIAMGEATGGRLGTAVFEELRALLLRRIQEAPDFWCHVGLVELQLYEALSQGRLAERWPVLQAGFAEHHARVAAPWMWQSVLDQARFVLAPAVPMAGPDRRVAEALLALLESYTEPDRASPRAARPTPDTTDATRTIVVWHGKDDAKLAAQLADRLQALGQAVTTHDAGDPTPGALPAVLRTARLALVLPPRGAARDATLQAQWDALVQAAWRRRAPVEVRVAATPRARLPEDLRKFLRVPPARDLVDDTDALKALLAEADGEPGATK